MCSVFFCLYLQLSVVALYCSRVSSGQHDLQYSASHQMTCFDLFLFSLLNTISGHFLFACLISYSFIENKKRATKRRRQSLFFSFTESKSKPASKVKHVFLHLPIKTKIWVEITVRNNQMTICHTIWKYLPIRRNGDIQQMDPFSFFCLSAPACFFSQTAQQIRWRPPQYWTSNNITNVKSISLVLSIAFLLVCQWHSNVFSDS